MSKLVQLLRCDGVRNAMLRYLDMRSWIVLLRATARSLRNFFSLDMLSAAVRLPKPDKGSFVDQYHKYLWFFGLPNFSDDIMQPLSKNNEWTKQSLGWLRVSCAS